ncbi:pectinesterase 2-like [Tasmannia lanceolata]|uniref:pectinesterase 2-like n=1 Tax=Tasmannia lanceolata TaxID=3420 RepID=UPI004064BFF1
MKSWCSHTPNPAPCEQFMSHGPYSSSQKRESEFHKMAIQIALERALHAQSHIRSLEDKFQNKLEKVAWEDCLVLYEITILQLNRTMDGSGRFTQDDIQTWLSAALTNLETCRTGFVELGVQKNMLSLLSNNVYELIVNALALNKLKPSSGQKYNSGLPNWVSGGDRNLLHSSPSDSQANIVVAQDGSGDFRTIKEAIKAASNRKESGRLVIYVKAGIYNENVEIGHSLKNIMLVGDGIGKSIVTSSKSVSQGYTTFRSATFGVMGDGFIAQGMTFRNTAGPSNEQAVALRSGSHNSVFYRCSFEGYQDTLYVYTQRQFYRECDIYGTVDFIFGNAAVVLQNCTIYPRRPLNEQNITITAHGRTSPDQNTGIVIHNCTIIASSELKKVQSSVKTYLGRPWKKYSRTVYLETFLDSLIDPSGWSRWIGHFALKNLYYGEYRNTGPGSSTSNRVKWHGYHALTDPSKASEFTVENFISGESWIPSTGVPFNPGL